MILEIIGIGAAALLIARGVSWAKSSEKLIVSSRARIHKVTFSKITIAVVSTVKNPTNHSYKFKHPLITLEYKKQAIGTSTVENHDYTLEPFKQIELKDVMVELSVFKLPTLALDLFNILTTQKGSAPIVIRTLVPVDVAGQIVSITYEDTVNL